MSFDDYNYNYFNDRRTIAASRATWYESLDRKKMKASVLLYNDEDGEVEVEVDVVFEVCSLCHGKGTHVNPAIDAGGLTRDDFNDDPDFYQEYRSGRYDVRCAECNGHNVVPTISPDADPEIAKRIQKKIQDDHDYAHLCAMERAMGC